MNELYSILSDEDIKNVMETNPKISTEDDNNIISKINILKKINCSNDIIGNIISTNPFYLTNDINDTIDLVNKLYGLGLTNLNITFDTNPYLLNRTSYEIDDFIKDNSTKTKEEIMDMIDSGDIDG